MPTAEERTAPCDALVLEANSLIDATSAGIFREHTEPNSMCISILENDLNELHEQRLAVAAANSNLPIMNDVVSFPSILP